MRNREQRMPLLQHLLHTQTGTGDPLTLRRNSCLPAACFPELLNDCAVHALVPGPRIAFNCLSIPLSFTHSLPVKPAPSDLSVSDRQSHAETAASDSAAAFQLPVMAFRRKDGKKFSYYVLFLGAKEARGLRGEEYVLPAMRKLIEQERRIEPSKVTVQVSEKGLKIIQNVSKRSKHEHLTSKQKTEQVKHLIPHELITAVVQEEDIVCCLLLICNPVTRCPAHVHAYRCDSVETASAFRESLQTFAAKTRPGKKVLEVDSCLSSVQQIGSREVQLRRSGGSSSDDRSSTRTQGSDGTGEFLTVRPPAKMSFRSPAKTSPPRDTLKSPVSEKEQLFESLAHELKIKLNPSSGPLLLPPRDYDTISRGRGKLNGIEERKSTNQQIVGVLAGLKTRENRGNNNKLATVYSSSNSSSSSASRPRQYYFPDPSFSVSSSSGEHGTSTPSLLLKSVKK